MISLQTKKLLELALQEDVGSGDYTSLATIPASIEQKAVLKVKANGILAGMEMAEAVFELVDPNLSFEPLMNDGDTIKIGDIAFYVSGKAQSILTAERLVLNIMQRMSGIATTTSEIVWKLDGLKTKVLDTRKTTPNFRIFEKEAVRIGGGGNHRFGLYDQILIKDNHVDYAGGVTAALQATQDFIKAQGLDIQVEIEARSMAEVEEVLNFPVLPFRILLDNFSPQGIAEAVKFIAGRTETEASGGINPDNVRAYAEAGVDYISMGYLTHHVKSLDLSLKAVK